MNQPLDSDEQDELDRLYEDDDEDELLDRDKDRDEEDDDVQSDDM